jgi:hypothetical protein
VLVAHGAEVEPSVERFAHHGVAVEKEEGAGGFAEQLAAAGLQGLVGLLVAGDGDAGAGVSEPQGGERLAGHRLVEITAAGVEAVDDLQLHRR